MYFASLADLIAMNGHGIYVWSAYAIGYAVLAALIMQPLARHAALSRQVRQQQDED
jgi:heme exporter protein D